MQAINRRRFIQAGVATPLFFNPSFCESSLLTDNPITVSIGKINVQSPWFGDKKWGIGFNDILINGLTIPKFSWGWLGISLAGGVVSMVGGLVFEALFQSLGLGGPSMDELLHKQLEAIEKIVDQKIRENELRRCVSLLDSIERLMREFVNNRGEIFRLREATADSSRLLSNLTNLDYPAYKMFMIAANLRLSILQEWAVADKREVKNYSNAIEEYSTFHETWKQRIEPDQLKDNTFRKQANHLYAELGPDPFADMKKFEKLAKTYEIGTLRLTEPIMGVPPEEMPRLPKNHDKVSKLSAQLISQDMGNLFDPIPLENKIRMYSPNRLIGEKQPYLGVVDWKLLHDRLFADTIAVGESIVAKWKEAKFSV